MFGESLWLVLAIGCVVAMVLDIRAAVAFWCEGRRLLACAAIVSFLITLPFAAAFGLFAVIYLMGVWHGDLEPPRD